MCKPLNSEQQRQRMKLYELVRTELQDLSRTPVEREYLFDTYFSLERELFDVDDIEATNTGDVIDGPYTALLDTPIPYAS